MADPPPSDCRSTVPTLTSSVCNPIALAWTATVSVTSPTFICTFTRAV